MFELIIVVWIIFIVVARVKKKADQAAKQAKPNVPRKVGQDETAYAFTDIGQSKEKQTAQGSVRQISSGQMQAARPQTARSQTGQQTAGSQTRQQTAGQMRYAAQGNRTTVGNSDGTMQTQSTAYAKAEQKEQSTTELLREKARKEAQEDMLERQKQNMENQKNYGTLNYAERFLPGDPVPKNMRLVICDYCNAENLVPYNMPNAKYNCYFCREKLH